MAGKAFDIKEIRELAGRFNPLEIEHCIDMHLREEKHECPLTGTSEHIIGELAKAGYVRKRVDEGARPLDAIRELAERIRSFQHEHAGKKKNTQP
ncbi:MAG: hypothetical protein M0018_09650 [Nitrospiraceae bacterium]|nr:hypothetical protein [Nitrospiraceae bacterium]